MGYIPVWINYVRNADICAISFRANACAMEIVHPLYRAAIQVQRDADQWLLLKSKSLKRL